MKGLSPDPSLSTSLLPSSSSTAWSSAVPSPTTPAKEIVSYAVEPVVKFRPLSVLQKLAFLVLAVGCKHGWKHIRQHAFQQAWGGYPEQDWRRRCNRLIVFGDNTLKVLGITNFILFLYYGRYPNLVQRLLGIRTVNIHPRSVRHVAFDLMNQQLVWHGFSEFFLFVLPLVNFHKIFGLLNGLLTPTYGRNVQNSCPVCSADPIVTPSRANCGHLFCYYCLRASRIAEPQYRCPRCQTQITSQQPHYTPAPAPGSPQNIST